MRYPVSTIEAICKYWTDRRRARTQPLLRRLQIHYQDLDEVRRPTNLRNTKDAYLTMKVMRQGMERVRILLELIKKREETKKDRIEVSQKIVELCINEGHPFPQDLTLSYHSGIVDEAYNLDAEVIDDMFGMRKKRKTSQLSNRELKKIKRARLRENDEILTEGRGVGEVLNQHCHHCKKRRPKCAICPYNKTHRYCSSCVKRHFNLDYDQLAEDPTSFWSSGCPKCDGTCPCAVCRNQNHVSTPGKKKSQDEKVQSKKERDHKGKSKLKRERERREREREKRELELERLEEERLERERELQELEEEEDSFFIAD